MDFSAIEQALTTMASAMVKVIEELRAVADLMKKNNELQEQILEELKNS